MLIFGKDQLLIINHTKPLVINQPRDPELLIL